MGQEDAKPSPHGLQLRLRPATRADALQMTAVKSLAVIRSYGHTLTDEELLDWQAQFATLDELYILLDRPNSTTLVAVDAHDAIHGYCQIRAEEGLDGIGFMTIPWVATPGHAIGALLVDTLLEQARTSGWTELRAIVIGLFRHDLDFYLRRGFKVTEITEGDEFGHEVLQVAKRLP